jgi:hypothetical protein
MSAATQAIRGNLPSNDSSESEVVNVGSIRITIRTILIGNQVFQFHNVTGFGVTDVYDPPMPIPWTIIFILAIVGLGLFAVGNIAILFALIALGIAGWLLYSGLNQPKKDKKAALKIYLNSGYARTIIASENFVMKVVETLYEFMERRETNKVLNISFEKAEIQNVVIGDDTTIQK